MASGRRTPTPRSKTPATGAAAPSASGSRRSSGFGNRRPAPIAILPPEWSEFLSSLTSRRVRFVVVGAHALAALGHPRNTADLDVFLEPSATNARRFGEAVGAFGLPALAAVAHELAEGQKMTRIGNPPLRIDVMNPIDGVTFAEAWAGRQRRRIDGIALAFLGEAEFRRNKRASGRPKDLLDLALLDEVARQPAHRGRRRAR